MDSYKITEALRRRLDIERLRPMQAKMMDTRSSAVMLAAPTGSGKTVAFGCYMLRRVGEPCGKVQAVVTVPSRELALQVSDVVRRMASGLKTTTVYGGHRVADELPTLTPCPDIIIATPGRLLDLLQRGALEIHDPATVVVDEFDKTLDLGFADEMQRLMRRIGRPGSLVLTSATPMDHAELPQWAQRPGCQTLDYSAPAEKSGHLDRVEVESPVRDKAETLADLLCAISDAGQRRTIVFVNHRESAERLHELLRRDGIESALYHGGLQQTDREAAVARLRGGSVPVLVATDLAARGLDIEGGIDAVVHYHMPPYRRRLDPPQRPHRAQRSRRHRICHHRRRGEHTRLCGHRPTLAARSPRRTGYSGPDGHPPHQRRPQRKDIEGRRRGLHHSPHRSKGERHRPDNRQRPLHPHSRPPTGRRHRHSRLFAPQTQREARAHHPPLTHPDLSIKA